MTVAFSPRSGWALVVHSVIHDEDFTTETRVMQSFHSGRVVGGPDDVGSAGTDPRPHRQTHPVPVQPAPPLRAHLPEFATVHLAQPDR